MAHVTNSSTLGFTCTIGWDEDQFKEGDFIQTKKNPDYVAQITEMKTKSGNIKASATIIGEYPTRPFQPCEENTIEKASAREILNALQLPSDGLDIGTIRDLDTRLCLPPNRAVQKHIGVYGKTGSGKSYTGAVIVEELLSLQKSSTNGIGLVIIDPHGEYGSLKLNPDKQPSDFSVTEYGHPEFTDADSKHDVRDVTTNPENLIQPTSATVLNLKGLDTDTQQEIVQTVSNDLFQLRLREQIPPTKLVIEEAHLFAPTGGKTKTRDIIENIAKEGRKFSFTINCITQRPSELYANIRAQMQSVFIHKLTDDTDIKKITKSSEGIDKTWGTPIQKLSRGECLLAGDMIESPVFIDVRERNTLHYESSGLAFTIDEYANDPNRVKEKQEKLKNKAQNHPVSKLKDKIQQLKKEKHKLEEKYEKLKNETNSNGNEELKSEISDLKSNVEEKQKEIDKMVDKINNLKSERDKLLNKLNNKSNNTQSKKDEENDSKGYYDDPQQILKNRTIQKMIDRYHEKINSLDETNKDMITYIKMNGASRPGDAYFYAGGKRSSGRANERVNKLEKQNFLTHESREHGRKYYLYALPEQIKNDLPNNVSNEEADTVIEEIEDKLLEELPM